MWQGLAERSKVSIETHFTDENLVGSILVQGKLPGSWGPHISPVRGGNCPVERAFTLHPTTPKQHFRIVKSFSSAQSDGKRGLSSARACAADVRTGRGAAASEPGAVKQAIRTSQRKAVARKMVQEARDYNSWSFCYSLQRRLEGGYRQIVFCGSATVGRFSESKGSTFCALKVLSNVFEINSIFIRLAHLESCTQWLSKTYKHAVFQTLTCMEVAKCEILQLTIYLHR